jgi:tetratricopeptide (TPR) repeat protein
MSHPPKNAKRKLPSPLKTSQNNRKILTLIDQSLAFHQMGKYGDAKLLYEKVLSLEPNHFDAIQLLGALSVQTKQYSEAIEFLSKAIQINPNLAECHSNLGISFKELKRFDEALLCYNKAISLKPNYLEAHLNRGNVLRELQRFDEALGSYENVIALSSDYKEAYCNRGMVMHLLGRLNEALASYDKAISIEPRYHDAHFNRGNVLKDLNRFEEALVSYDNAIAITANDPETYSNRGLVLRALNRLDEALYFFDLAIVLRPKYATAYSNRALILQELNRLDEAIYCLDKAISINSESDDASKHSNVKFLELEHINQTLPNNDAVIYFNRGNMLRDLNRLDEAILSYEKSILIAPDHCETYNNLGLALKKLNRLDEAILCCDKAIALKSDYVEAHLNRSVILQGLNRLDEALLSNERALAINPIGEQASQTIKEKLKASSGLAQNQVRHGEEPGVDANGTAISWNFALCNLLNGNLKEGWRHYESRRKDVNASKNTGIREFDEPLWLGNESLNNKTILLYAEQGLGDTLQFSRYASMVAKLGAKVILEVQPALVGLLKNIEGVSEIIARGERLSDFDYQCPLLSLPLAFNTELHNIPPVTQNIAINTKKISYWDSRLGEKSKPRIGIAWRGNSAHSNDHNRSLSLSQLLDCLPKGLNYISLQKEISDNDQESLLIHGGIKFFGDSLHDFTDTAALCELMDIVISVDTSIAHLAGTLNKPTWVLLPFSPDWRWLLNRNDSPWYPSVRLYRQEKIGQWNSALDEIKSDLEKMKVIYNL